MPENYEQGEEIIVGNRRLRKIKRPKQHATPISSENTPNVYSQNTQNQTYSAQEAPSYAQNDDQYTQNYNLPYDNKPFTYETAEEQSFTQNNQSNSNVPQYYEPQMNAQTQNTPQENYVQDDMYAYDQNQQIPYASSSYLYGTVEKKKVLWIALLCLFVGVFIGAIFFKGSNQVVQNGLQGVVINPEVPKGRARCGVAEKMQGCVLYVMNPQRQELNGRDFYDLASQLTGRQRFVIETGNMRYSSVKIRPGAIAQLNIPPLQ